MTESQKQTKSTYLMKTSFKNYPVFITTIFLFFTYFSSGRNTDSLFNSGNKPHIVNIINFIRLCEPRPGRNITNEMLYTTVENQIEMMKKYQLGGTFLLQYDALISPDYQKLLKTLPQSSFEIGAWWEIPQQLAEKAGLKWRGRYSWDWHASVGFSTGYTPKEREKLVDIYMKDFKQVFGYYPKSVGSWFIDEHTLNYMYRKYKIVASCNCKDQIGTDGYSLWGGYWNQAYYPSLKNAYMPAQTEKGQIPVPIFRMLGSDPVRQYESGLGGNGQNVITMEPVSVGADRTWVEWYFDQLINGACMEFAYTQVGQENSFTWSKISKGFEVQLPLIAKLRDGEKIKIETLAQSGQWFKNHFKVTPATTVTVRNDLSGSKENYKTVWFNSRFFRANLLWENGTMRFRDIHLFDENIPSDYLEKAGTSDKASFYTLPFIDGHEWSSMDKTAGLYLKISKDGNEILVEGKTPLVTDSLPGKLHIVWPLKSVKANFIIDIDEFQISMKMEGNTSVEWFFDLPVVNKTDIPFVDIKEDQIDCIYKGYHYSVTATTGSFTKASSNNLFRILPKTNCLILQFK